jgi:hypothetical protein
MKDLVGSDLIEYNMEIDPNQRPIRQRQFRFAKSERDEIEKQISELKQAGIIQPSTSPWRMPIFLVEKKDVFDNKRAKRLVFDARYLNHKSKEYAYRIDSINQTLDYLSEYRPKLFSSIDLRSCIPTNASLPANNRLCNVRNTKWNMGANSFNNWR